MKWIEALKIYNQTTEKWYIPKKDTPEYHKVREIMKQDNQEEKDISKNVKKTDKTDKTDKTTKEPMTVAGINDLYEAKMKKKWDKILNPKDHEIFKK